MSNFIWSGKQRFGREVIKPDLTRCRCAVSDGLSFPNYHQCRRKAVVFREHLGYCSLHDPVNVNKRYQARMTKSRARSDAANLPYKKADAYEKALKEIALYINLESGAIAQRALNKFKKRKTE